VSSYKIKEIEVLTGIKAHTLRIWEKRYDLLTPSRTDTKIRTYSGDDLKTLLNIAILYESGWKISKIAALSNEEVNALVQKETKVASGSNTIVNLLIQALIDNNSFEFERCLDIAIKEDGFYKTYLESVLPFLSRIGILWTTGSINVSQEHFASNLIRQKLISAIDRLDTPKSDNVEFILYTPEGEPHEMSLLFYHYMLKKKGYSLIYLGVNVPESDLYNIIESVQPRALVTSLVRSNDVESTLTYFENLKNLGLPIYGKGWFVEHANLIQKGIIIDIQDLFFE
jgi:DNA-binding transcriptional MerR regulator